jgi:uncharacterized membrane protein
VTDDRGARAQCVGTSLAAKEPVAVPDQVHDNIATIAQLRERIASGVSRHQRAIESFAQRLGRPVAVYVLLGLVIGWVAYNAFAHRFGWYQIDGAPFFWLQGVVALYAALVTTLILVAQRRQRDEAEQHAHLEFQLNLLAEQKATKIIALLEELRRDLPNVRDRMDPVAEAMQQEVDPHAVHSAINDDVEPK